MAKAKFRLKQVDLSHGTSWVGLSFYNYIERGGSEQLSLVDPVISRVCAENVDYGRLFAYCFRRFGYPERGWDGYKELVRYYLSTPNQNLILCIEPSVSTEASLSLLFLTTKELFFQIEKYARKEQDEWECRRCEWAEEKGLPDWMSEWLALCREQLPILSEYYSNYKMDSWKDVLTFPFAFERGTRAASLAKQVKEFNVKIMEAYKLVEPYPQYYERPSNLNNWEEGDPLKPLALAALEALKDLHTPVGVRDALINAFGEVNCARSSVERAESAGYPSGALGNKAPKEFAEIHQRVIDFGAGDVKAGIKQLIDIASATRDALSANDLQDQVPRHAIRES